jgi:flagella basal body P-ring formation protein FlgA
MNHSPTLTRVIASLALPALASLPLAARATLPAASADIAVQDLRAIEESAKAEIRRQAPESIPEVAPLDARLRLTACDRPLRATLPPNISLGTRATVRITCSGGTTNWGVNVPVALFSELPVVVAERPLTMGSIVGEDDVALVVRRFPGTARCCATALDQVVGRLVRRSVPADQVLPLDALEEAPTVRRGETVTVIASLPGVEIRSTGVALADARAGETVRIRHATSLKVFQARADTQGVVRVDR